MDTRQLKTFRTLAKNLSFSQTAEELNYAQSSISAQIRSLENELRLPLFNRLGKKVALTDEGRNVLEYANRFMSIEEEFIESLKNKDDIVGELNVYAPNSICVYLLPTLLAEFRETIPNVNFKLQAHLGTRRAMSELRAGNIDIMVVMEESFNDPDFNVTRLKYEEIVLVCHNSHPLADVPSVSLDDLKEEQFILTEPTCGYRNIITREMLSRGHKLSPIMWFDNAEAIKQCVMSNLGISFLPKMAVESDIECGAFSKIRLDQKFDTLIRLQLITHKDKWISPALKAFVGALEENFS